MNKATLLRLQEEAHNAYNRVPQSEAAAWAQVIATTELALQQARAADAFESLSLGRLYRRIEALEAQVAQLEERARTHYKGM